MIENDGNPIGDQESDWGPGSKPKAKVTWVPIQRTPSERRSQWPGWLVHFGVVVVLCMAGAAVLAPQILNFIMSDKKVKVLNVRKNLLFKEAPKPAKRVVLKNPFTNEEDDRIYSVARSSAPIVVVSSSALSGAVAVPEKMINKPKISMAKQSKKAPRVATKEQIPESERPDQPPAKVTLSRSLASKIREDKDRIYLDETYEVGDLTWGIRNVSPNYGVEVWVENNGINNTTYYMPKAVFDGKGANFEGSMIAPKQRIYGFVEHAKLKGKTQVIAEFGAVGAQAKRVKVRLTW